ncbi:GNAT family N-acetyltransferase [Streptomyces sp. NPDC051572]|uniref:GNAT family N-acetyltransferase n=1 Tax=Streptomyces sp. NPDC051572 TaxID=3155802 RepID=UPI00344FF7B8
MIHGKNPAPVPAQLRLTGEDLVLREWTENDLPAMTDLFDDPEIAHWTPLGEVLVTRQNANGLTASLGYSVGAAYGGRRLGARALTVMTEYAHHALDLPRSTLSIATDNAASAAVARAAGYHLTDEPPTTTVRRGWSLTLRTWARDRP